MPFRCVICWAKVPWSRGCADDAEIAISTLVNQQAFTDRARQPRRIKHRRPQRISDGGLCDDCWDGMGADHLDVSEAEPAPA